MASFVAGVMHPTPALTVDRFHNADAQSLLYNMGAQDYAMRFLQLPFNPKEVLT